MAVCRVEKNKNYTTMSNYHLRDPCLSNKARGLLSTMLSLPETWDYTTRGLAKICKDGVDGITAQLKELEQYGYLVRHRIRDSNGRIVDMEYVIYERPHTASPDTEMPYLVKPDMDLPRLETPAQINIDKRITDEINTDSVNTHSFFSDGSRPSVLAALEAKRKETTVRDMDEYRELIKENIDYDILLSDMPYDHDRLEEILELIVETVCSTKKYIRVAGTDYPAEIVRSRLLKLDASHIQFVFDCLKENTTKIRNIKQYLLTTLYNAPTTIGNYYSALVQHDMYGDSRD
ncbi:MAG: helix-turn-helix domain-containing protein [Lachnospiraceae bacterium]|nr:helix-turn-helix domain-containing protein [Lachnospiraceae bacterium]